MTAIVEHANITVKDPHQTISFLQAAIPKWKVRGFGDIEWFGKPITWYHIGDDRSYVALSSGGEGDAIHWTSHQVGVKHLGIVVANLEQVMERLDKEGFEMDHRGGEHPHRRSAYYIDPNGIQFEFVEYLSNEADLRNDYKI